VVAAGVCGTDVHIYDLGRRGAGTLPPPIHRGHEFAATWCRSAPSSPTAGGRPRRPRVTSCADDATCARTGNAHVCPNTKIIGVTATVLRRLHRDAASNVWHLDDGVSFEVGGIHTEWAMPFTRRSWERSCPARRCSSRMRSIGLFAVGICRAAGASRIIRERRERPRLALARTLGADDAVHPRRPSAPRRQRRTGWAWTWCSRCRRANGLTRHLGLGGPVQMLGIPVETEEIDFATEIIFKASRCTAW